jgi:hypothetical protein
MEILGIGAEPRSRVVRKESPVLLGKGGAEGLTRRRVGRDFDVFRRVGELEDAIELGLEAIGFRRAGLP